MSYRYLPPLLLLLAVTLVKANGAGAPGDGDIQCNSIPAVANTITLLDTDSYADLGSTFDFELRWNSSGPECMQELSACTGITESDNAELTTQDICYSTAAPGAVEIAIDVNFVFDNSTSGCEGQIQFFSASIVAFDAPVMPAITCGNASPQTLYFPVSDFGGEEPFDLTLRALAVLGSPFCVTVTQFRVYVQQCAEGESAQATYGAALSGQTVAGECVANSVVSAGSTLNATCGRDGLHDFDSAGGCECEAGFQPDANECQACDVNFFKAEAGNVNCVSCPDNSAAPITGSTECACVPNYVRSTIDVTTACDVCAVGSFRDGSSSCVVCPAGSSTATTDASECQCDGSTTTRDGSSTTTSDPCGEAQCNPGLFFTNGQCENCPYQSNTDGSNPGATQCVCNAGYVDGTETVTTTGCADCAADFYQTGTVVGGEAICTACPANSARGVAMAATDGCPCNTNYDRIDGADLGSDCVVQYGFTTQDLTVAESDSGSLTVELAGSISETVTVTVQGTPPDGVTVSPMSLDFTPGGSLTQTITITVANDDVALEPVVTFSLTLETSDAILGGARFETVQVDVTDDGDSVTVGFISSSVSFNESDGQVTVTVGKSVEIGSNLMLTISATIGVTLVDENVEFVPGPINQVQVSLSIPNDEADNEDMVSSLTLEVSSPDSRVTIGTGPTYFTTLEVTILDDDPPEPSEGLATGAIIGIAAGAAGGAVVAACLCLICVLVCRFRVNRQGYYATYEDKAAEPSMIRYSASLRSISSQTVVPAEGKAASAVKENEFYV